MQSALIQVILTGLLASSSIASPLRKRADDVVQGRLGSDGYWNDYDGKRTMGWGWPRNSHITGGLNHYTMYEGNGSVASGWPDELTWVSFNNLWVTSQQTILRSCDILYNTTNNSDQEIRDLYDAIKTVAHETRVDHRFILAAVIQETRGCVRAKTSVSPDGIKNPGLLQSFKGTYTCNDEKGKVTTPCPRKTILGMIRDGGASMSMNSKDVCADH
jgi:hypothetical protein